MQCPEPVVDILIPGALWATAGLGSNVTSMSLVHTAFLHRLPTVFINKMRICLSCELCVAWYLQQSEPGRKAESQVRLNICTLRLAQTKFFFIIWFTLSSFSWVKASKNLYIWPQLFLLKTVERRLGKLGTERCYKSFHPHSKLGCLCILSPIICTAGQLHLQKWVICLHKYNPSYMDEGSFQ